MLGRVFLCIAVLWLNCSSALAQTRRPHPQLSVESSMTHDPEALACVRSACKASSVVGLKEFDIRLGRCQREHHERIWNTWSESSRANGLRASNHKERKQMEAVLFLCRQPVLKAISPFKRVSKVLTQRRSFNSGATIIPPHIRKMGIDD